MNHTQIALSTDYESMQQLTVAQKRRDSQTLDQPSQDTQEEDPEIIIAPTLMEEKEQDIDHMFDQEQEPVIAEILKHYSYHEPSSDMDELELEESEQDVMEQDELKQDESKQDELKQDESKQDESKQDELKQEETEEAIDHSRVLLLREEFLAQFHQKGFTEWIADEQYDQTVDLLAKGYIGRNQQHSPLPNDIYGVIIHFYAIKKESFGNNNNLVEVQSGQRTYFTLGANISLSKILVSREKQSASKRIIIELKEIKTETLEHILEYLGHHNGRQPAELLFPSGNSMELSQTVQDPWEAKWIAKFDDETISKIVFAAQWLGLRHLKRLANNAKIALIYAAWLQIQ